MYDVTSAKTFEGIDYWANSIHEHADENVVKFLIANKVDLTDERKVSKEDGMKMAARYGMKYFETSAKANINVTETVEAMVRDVVANVALKDAAKRNIVIGNGKKEEKNEQGCCTIM